MRICQYDKCCGCGLCSQICPKKCIEMKEDDIGHLYPTIDKKKCVRCKLCEINCPSNNISCNKKAMNVYASWAKELPVRKSSTSGGIAAILAKQFLQNNVIVYGSSLDNGKVQHIRITSVNDVVRIQGSKYVESPIINILPQILDDLKQGRNVAFFGTPCQCAAVRRLGLQFEKQLFLIELICTGVPPQKLLWEHLKIHNPSKVTFRDETGSRLTVWNENSIIYQKPFWKDLFLTGFRNHLFLRESCYHCQYASLNRGADITLGDYWGIGKDFRIRHDISNGVSVVFINSEKGAEIFEQIKTNIFYERRLVEEAVAGNIRYSCCSSAHRNRRVFLDIYKSKGFKKAIKKALVRERIKNMYYSMKQSMKKILMK